MKTQITKYRSGKVISDYEMSGEVLAKAKEAIEIKLTKRGAHIIGLAQNQGDKRDNKSFYASQMADEAWWANRNKVTIALVSDKKRKNVWKMNHYYHNGTFPWYIGDIEADSLEKAIDFAIKYEVR